MTIPNVRHDRVSSDHFQARTLSLSAIRMADRRGRAACDADLATPRTGTFARAG
jgi:hypothetical protein